MERKVSSHPLPVSRRKTAGNRRSIGTRQFTQHRLPLSAVGAVYMTAPTALCDVSPLDGSTSRPEQEVGRQLRDLPAVLNTFFNGASEVNADNAVLVSCLGKAGVRTKHRGRIRTPIPGRQRQAAGVERDVIGSEELLQGLCGRTPYHAVSRVVVRHGIGQLQWSPHRVRERVGITIGGSVVNRRDRAPEVLMIIRFPRMRCSHRP